MILYGLKSCDTCRKALKALPGAEFVDLRGAGIPQAVMSAAHERFGASLVNTRSATWRGLSEAERTAEPLALLQRHPALMKRPLIVAGDRMYLGWTGDVQRALTED